MVDVFNRAVDRVLQVDIVFTLPSPVSLIVSLVDLAFVPVFVLLARRSPRVAAYARACAYACL